MRIAIVGSGAIGCAYGLHLAEAGHAARLVDVSNEHVAAIRERGLTVEQSGGERTVALDVSTDIAVARDAEVVLIAVKSFANDDVATALAPVLAPGAIVVTVQNGIGNDARLAAILGPARVVQGSTTVGGEILAPGRLRVVPGTVRGESRTVLGRPGDPVAAATAERFAAVLRDSGLPAEVLDDVRDVVWRKAVFAAAVGPLCATLGGTVADVLERPTASALLRRAFAEIVEVAASAGVSLELDEVSDQARSVYRSIGAHPPSLAVDVAHGRRTEVESQVGEICRRGAAAGIPTPVCDVLATLVRCREPATEEKSPTHPRII